MQEKEVRGTMVRHYWKAPLDGLVKVNWDVAVDIHTKEMGIGVIVIDSTGEV